VVDFSYYTVPYNAVVKFAVISGAVVRVLMPRVAAVSGAGGNDIARDLTERADDILVVGMVGVLAPFVALAPELLDAWVGADFALRSTLPARILLVGMAINTAAFPAHSVVLARGRPVLLTALYAFEVVFHLVIVYLAVTGFGIAGAATAWAARVAIDTVAQRALAARTLGLPLRNHATVWGLVAALALLALASHWTPYPAARAIVGVALSVACFAWMFRGPRNRLLVDSILPWRWDT
jgi:O-antigen/teichoic acid export membrane protein